ncbi:MAG: hypothetical protein J1E41_07845 [Ruminococcus sp.]|nr:hypothetical protein [Ruminococcus sp.]
MPNKKETTTPEKAEAKEKATKAKKKTTTKKAATKKTASKKATTKKALTKKEEVSEEVLEDVIENKDELIEIENDISKIDIDETQIETSSPTPNDTNDTINEDDEFDDEAPYLSPRIYVADEEETVASNNDLLMTLARLRTHNVVVPVELVSFETTNNTLCFVGKLPEPYDVFDILIPIKKQFYIPSDKEFATIEERDNKLLEDISAYYLGATVYVCITRAIHSKRFNKYIVYGSRKKGMAVLKQRYYVDGVFNSKLRKKQRVHNGLIVENCNVTRVLKDSIEVEVLGVSTRIPIWEISWKYVREANEIFSVGDVTDVKVKSITTHKEKNYTTLECSIKETTENPTLPILKKAAERKSRSVGVVVGAKADRCFYKIWAKEGYNAIALSQKTSGTFVEELKRPDLNKKAVIGSVVEFRPLGINPRDPSTMMVHIQRVIK